MEQEKCIENNTRYIPCKYLVSLGYYIYFYGQIRSTYEFGRCTEVGCFISGGQSFILKSSNLGTGTNQYLKHFCIFLTVYK